MKINNTFKVIIFLVAVILSGCSANNQLRRAKKLIAKAELNGAKWSSDTVYIKVPVFVKETALDSIFVTLPGDTVILTKDRLHVKFVDLPGDSVFIQGKCDSMVIVKEVPVTVTKVIHGEKSGLRWWWLIVAFAAGIVISFFASLRR